MKKSGCPTSSTNHRVPTIAEDPKYLPQYKTEGAACADLRACIKPIVGPGGIVSPNASVLLNFRGAARISTGLKMEIPAGMKLCFSVRSSLGDRGLVITNSPAQIDSDYRGTIEISVMNLGRELIKIEDGDRIAQCWLDYVYKGQFDPVTELTPTARGDGGFGSTGTN